MIFEDQDLEEKYRSLSESGEYTAKEIQKMLGIDKQ
tara:strand:+ start:371 stop:478 length:108 start_codon:yes stop_codon:yes gene_type:complete